MYVKVRVKANARREEFEKVSETSFKISVREKAQEDAANRRVVELVAAHFKVPIKSVRIIRGHRTSSKVLSF
ncbi:hypothetical protein A3A39_00830 [Candidatus Kaiserbacteria bacterium RIFCSPLOWO2_01_FULL_54_13]|uniref:Uncharacterized protein n=1 Tax=Candidatus Kaiserbacteria bacterium RIFCSPLOWO2_01_FULL_54_13 TaxID=1798512 RepID=A0A1F6F124_9BACT|nr:MAG: hypothetical protein A3A39_00830 [Candidatus Kaiserbacteria bacterium RIFCSPLOWO2_01_FULL_54_13]